MSFKLHDHPSASNHHGGFDIEASKKRVAEMKEAAEKIRATTAARRKEHEAELSKLHAANSSNKLQEKIGRLQGQIAETNKSTRKIEDKLRKEDRSRDRSDDDYHRDEYGKFSSK